ncbi:hypothetical protein [Cellvibrio sp. PSBB006]|uniref:hypothetical protein n=1 Tax=Cellvibrio sp. PSBB006 TaxID=1987723 RepID=UPI000B3B7799|nr:hypothetical protein [Cellvibrio sp. PSBB006]ARU26152.1 hypothetical protein CBR65_01180 [Cellvibrio sp. PSBB006]
MNNKPIDLKSVLFTLSQLQSTLEVLSQRVQPVPQGAYDMGTSPRLSAENLQTYPAQEKNRS